MNPSDMQLFHLGSTFFMKFPNGAFFSITVAGSCSIIDELPPAAKIVREYPNTGIENTPPSSTLSVMKAALMVAKYFAKKPPPTSTEEKGA